MKRNFEKEIHDAATMNGLRGICPTRIPNRLTVLRWEED